MRLELRGLGPRAALERVARRDRREREDAGGPGRRRSEGLGIEACRHLGQRVEHPSRITVLRRLQVRIDSVIHRVQFFGDCAVSPRGRARRDVGVDRFLPVAEPRKRVRRHVQRVRRRRRDLRVTPGRFERLIGERRKVVAVDDVVREAGMIRLAGDESFENRASLALLGERLVARRRGGGDRQRVEDRRFAVVRVGRGDPRHRIAIRHHTGGLIRRLEIGVEPGHRVHIRPLAFGLRADLPRALDGVAPLLQRPGPDAGRRRRGCSTG